MPQVQGKCPNGDFFYPDANTVNAEVSLPYLKYYVQTNKQTNNTNNTNKQHKQLKQQKQEATQATHATNKQTN
jgi:hypothetical protein